MDLPPQVKRRIENAWGSQGFEWASCFREKLRTASERWRFSDVRPFSNLSYHFVATAKMNGRDVVLKLGVPQVEFFRESGALREFAGKRSIELLEYDADIAAMVLERADSGVALEAIWTPQNDDESTQAIAQSMVDLWCSPRLVRFPTLRDWSQTLIENGPKQSPTLLQSSLKCLADLEGMNEAVLLHGDLHHGNVLQHGQDYKVIDPIGVIGDPAFEVYALLQNPVGASTEFCLDQWQRRIEIVSDATGLDRNRLTKGALLGVMISNCWNLEEGGTLSDTALELARRLEASIC